MSQTEKETLKALEEEASTRRTMMLCVTTFAIILVVCISFVRPFSERPELACIKAGGDWVLIDTMGDHGCNTTRTKRPIK